MGSIEEEEHHRHSVPVHFIDIINKQVLSSTFLGGGGSFSVVVAHDWLVTSEADAFPVATGKILFGHDARLISCLKEKSKIWQYECKGTDQRVELS